MSNQNDNKNYESLYKGLKEEYEQSKKDNDEICKEYESTIQLLTDSVESLEKEKKDLQIKLIKIENEQKNFKREKDNLIKKNKDKMIDIQCLNEQNDKLNKLIKKLKEEKSLFDTKIVTLENDIDHYQNKIREYEDFIDELKAQLEDALEEIITLQTEYETYKLSTGDQLLRKDEELRDIRNDNINKEKIIQRLTKKPNERINIQKEKEIFNNDKKLMNVRRRFTVLEKKVDLKFRRDIKKNFTIIKENENEYKTSKNDLNTIIEDTNYNKSDKKDLISKTMPKNKSDSHNDLNNNSYNNNADSEAKILCFNDDSENNNESIEKNENKNKEENISEVKNDNIKNKLNDNSINDIGSMINKQFKGLVICEENKIYVNPLVHKLLNKEQKKEFRKALKNMLNRIKQRKDNLYNKKNAIKEQFIKMSFIVK